MAGEELKDEGSNTLEGLEGTEVIRSDCPARISIAFSRVYQTAKSRNPDESSISVKNGLSLFQSSLLFWGIETY